jgi:hypothetical protein
MAASVPLDEGSPSRRRIGPFWIEEGIGLVVVGATLVAAAVVLFAIAFAARPA